MTQYYPPSLWYVKVWQFLKQFPQGLAQGAKNPPHTSGPAAAAIISAGIGCFLMMVSHHLAEGDRTLVVDTWLWSLGSWIPGSHNSNRLWGELGSYAGKETLLILGWLFSWLILHHLWKEKAIQAKTILFWLFTLFIAATVMICHPLFPYLPLI